MIATINPEVLTSMQASRYLGMEGDGDVLRQSRSSGKLWGIEPPKYLKAGTRKILYRRSDLDLFLAGLEVA